MSKLSRVILIFVGIILAVSALSIYLLASFRISESPQKQVARNYVQGILDGDFEKAARSLSWESRHKLKVKEHLATLRQRLQGCDIDQINEGENKIEVILRNKLFGECSAYFIELRPQRLKNAVNANWFVQPGSEIISP